MRLFFTPLEVKVAPLTASTCLSKASSTVSPFQAWYRPPSTTRFAQHVVEGGLYEAWNGLTPDEALNKEVDAVSGATYTSNGVKKSLIARLKAYQRQLKK